jgi:hypothetical protein
MRTLTASETDDVGGGGLPVAAYYGAVVLWEAAPAIAIYASGLLAGASWTLYHYVLTDN